MHFRLSYLEVWCRALSGVILTLPSACRFSGHPHSALFELVDTKSGYLTQAFGMPEYELLEYGFRQLANSIWRKK